MFSRVMTTLILNGPKSAAARASMAAVAVANEPVPRTRSLVAASAPSREIWMSR
jgi:hypothetical protein